MHTYGPTLIQANQATICQIVYSNDRSISLRPIYLYIYKTYPSL